MTDTNPNAGQSFTFPTMPPPPQASQPGQNQEARLQAVENAANVHQSAIGHFATVIDNIGQRSQALESTIAHLQQTVIALASELGYVTEGPNGEPVVTFPAPPEKSPNLDDDIVEQTQDSNREQ